MCLLYHVSVVSFSTQMYVVHVIFPYAFCKNDVSVVPFLNQKYFVHVLLPYAVCTMVVVSHFEMRCSLFMCYSCVLCHGVFVSLL
jgi:hypothetical protein